MRDTTAEERQARRAGLTQGQGDGETVHRTQLAILSRESPRILGMNLGIPSNAFSFRTPQGSVMLR